MLEVQQKLFDFDDFDYGSRKKRKNKKCSKKSDSQSKLDMGDYKDPVIKISDEHSNKLFVDEKNIIHSINPVYPHCKSRKVFWLGFLFQRCRF